MALSKRSFASKIFRPFVGMTFQGPSFTPLGSNCPLQPVFVGHKSFLGSLGPALGLSRTDAMWYADTLAPSSVNYVRKLAQDLITGVYNGLSRCDFISIGSATGLAGYATDNNGAIAFDTHSTPYGWTAPVTQINGFSNNPSQERYDIALMAGSASYGTGTLPLSAEICQTYYGTPLVPNGNYNNGSYIFASNCGTAQAINWDQQYIVLSGFGSNASPHTITLPVFGVIHNSIPTSGDGANAFVTLSNGYLADTSGANTSYDNIRRLQVQKEDASTSNIILQYKNCKKLTDNRYYLSGIQCPVSLNAGARITAAVPQQTNFPWPSNFKGSSFLHNLAPFGGTGNPAISGATSSNYLLNFNGLPLGSGQSSTNQPYGTTQYYIDNGSYTATAAIPLLAAISGDARLTTMMPISGGADRQHNDYIDLTDIAKHRMTEIDYLAQQFYLGGPRQNNISYLVDQGSQTHYLPAKSGYISTAETNNNPPGMFQNSGEDTNTRCFINYDSAQNRWYAWAIGGILRDSFIEDHLIRSWRMHDIAGNLMTFLTWNGNNSTGSVCDSVSGYNWDVSRRLDHCQYTSGTKNFVNGCNSGNAHGWKGAVYTVNNGGTVINGISGSAPTDPNDHSAYLGSPIDGGIITDSKSYRRTRLTGGSSTHCLASNFNSSQLTADYTALCDGSGVFSHHVMGIKQTFSSTVPSSGNIVFYPYATATTSSTATPGSSIGSWASGAQVYAFIPIGHYILATHTWQYSTGSSSWVDQGIKWTTQCNAQIIRVPTGYANKAQKPTSMVIELNASCGFSSNNVSSQPAGYGANTLNFNYALLNAEPQFGSGGNLASALNSGTSVGSMASPTAPATGSSGSVQLFRSSKQVATIPLNTDTCYVVCWTEWSTKAVTPDSTPPTGTAANGSFATSSISYSVNTGSNIWFATGRVISSDDTNPGYSYSSSILQGSISNTEAQAFNTYDVDQPFYGVQNSFLIGAPSFCKVHEGFSVSPQMIPQLCMYTTPPTMLAACDLSPIAVGFKVVRSPLDNSLQMINNSGSTVTPALSAWAQPSDVGVVVTPGQSVTMYNNGGNITDSVSYRPEVGTMVGSTFTAISPGTVKIASKDDYNLDYSETYFNVSSMRIGSAATSAMLAYYPYNLYEDQELKNPPVIIEPAIYPATQLVFNSSQGLFINWTFPNSTTSTTSLLGSGIYEMWAKNISPVVVPGTPSARLGTVTATVKLNGSTGTTLQNLSWICWNVIASKLTFNTSMGTDFISFTASDGGRFIPKWCAAVPITTPSNRNQYAVLELHPKNAPSLTSADGGYTWVATLPANWSYATGKTFILVAQDCGRASWAASDFITGV